MSELAFERFAIAVLLIVGFGLLGGSCWAWPQYRVYSARLDGQAQKAQAEGSRMVLISQAKAERESAVERAAAIKIVGEAAQKYPEYRTQEFIGAFGEALREGKMDQIIYVPTEANLPIMERRSTDGK